MVSVFDLATAMNESVNHSGGMNKISPMDIPSSYSLIESIQYVNNVILSEAVDFDNYSIGVDEVLFEAVAVKSPNVTMISESVLGNLGAQIKKFFAKVIAGIKAIIEKIKGFFTKYKESTEKWCSNIKPRLDNAKGNSGVTVTMYNWDEQMIRTEMMNGYAKITLGVVGKLVQKIDVKSVAFPTYRSDIKDEYKEKEASRATENIDKKIAELKKDGENKIAEFTKEMSLGDASSLEGLWSKIDTLVKGGEKQQEIRVDYSKAIKMYNFVDSADDANKAMSTVYSNFLSQIEAAQSNWNKIIEEMEKDVADRFEGYPKEIVNKYQEMIRAMAAETTGKISVATNIVNGLQTRNVSYLQSATKEYMSAVTKFVGGTQAKGHVTVHKA